MWRLFAISIFLQSSAYIKHQMVETNFKEFLFCIKQEWHKHCDPRQSIWIVIGKSSNIEKDSKSLISTFAIFFIAIARV